MFFIFIAAYIKTAANDYVFFPLVKVDGFKRFWTEKVKKDCGYKTLNNIRIPLIIKNLRVPLIKWKNLRVSLIISHKIKPYNGDLPFFQISVIYLDCLFNMPHRMDGLLVSLIQKNNDSNWG